MKKEFDKLSLDKEYSTIGFFGEYPVIKNDLGEYQIVVCECYEVPNQFPELSKKLLRLTKKESGTVKHRFGALIYDQIKSPMKYYKTQPKLQELYEMLKQDIDKDKDFTGDTVDIIGI